MPDYAYWKEWRLMHPSTRNRQRRANYAKTAVGAANRGQEWTTSDVEAITAEARPTDRALSELLGRSVQAIQVKRAKLRAEALRERADEIEGRP